MKNTLIALIFFAARATPETLTVCDTLKRLNLFDQTEVSIRGVWIAGDTGEVLVPQTGCESPLIRDGWKWRDAIELAIIDPARSKQYSVLQERLHQEIFGAFPQRLRILATFTGRLETREHFRVRRLPSGLKAREAFNLFVGRLSYRSVDDIVVTHYGPGDEEAEMDFRRRPRPTAVK